MAPEKQEMIELLAGTLEGKKLTEALPLLTEWKKEMKKQNIVFTAEEDKLLTDMLSAQLTPAQRQQFEYFKKFLGKKKF
jgi:hypothetical protein